MFMIKVSCQTKYFMWRCLSHTLYMKRLAYLTLKSLSVPLWYFLVGLW